jgi:hypothetical protein
MSKLARPVRLAYQPPANSTLLSEQTSNQPTILFSQNKPAPAISHQPNEQAGGRGEHAWAIRPRRHWKVETRAPPIPEIFFVYPWFSKIYSRFKNLQKASNCHGKWRQGPTAIENDSRSIVAPLPPFQLAVATVTHRRYCSGFLLPFPVAAGTTSLRKIITFWYDSDEDKIYTKIVTFDEIYNFVVQTFFIWNHLWTQKINVLSISQFMVSRSG